MAVMALEIQLHQAT
jgi:hypothetical protein